MPPITDVNVANAITKMVAARALAQLKANMFMGRLVNRNYDSEVAEHGDTINVPLPPTIVANSLARGATVTQQVATVGNAPIVLDTHIEATVAIPDVTKIFARPDLLELYMGSQIVAVAEKIEADLLGKWAGFTANPVLGTSGVAVTEALFDTAETRLFDAKVPAASPKYCAMSSDAYSTLRNIPRISEGDKVGLDAAQRAILGGEVTRVKDFLCFRSQLIPKVGSAPVSTKNFAFASDALCLVMRSLPDVLPGMGAVTETVSADSFALRAVLSYQPNSLSQQITIDGLYGIGVLRPTFGQVILS